MSYDTWKAHEGNPHVNDMTPASEETELEVVHRELAEKTRANDALLKLLQSVETTLKGAAFESLGVEVQCCGKPHAIYDADPQTGEPVAIGEECCGNPEPVYSVRDALLHDIGRTLAEFAR